MRGVIGGLKGLNPRKSKRAASAAVTLPGYYAVRMRSIERTTGSSWAMRELEFYPDENFAGAKLSGSSFVTAGATDVGSSGGDTSNNLFDGNLGNGWVGNSASATDVVVGLSFGAPAVSGPNALDLIVDPKNFSFSQGAQLKSFRFYTYDTGRLPATFAIDGFIYYLKAGVLYGEWRQLGVYSGFTYPGNNQWLGWATL